ncbi:MAG: M48 family metalloprotease [Myxococcota bacterium]
MRASGRGWAGGIAAILALAGCFGTDPALLEPLAREPEKASDERIIWEQAAHFEQALAASEEVVRDEALQAYLDGVTRSVYARMNPPRGVEPRVVVVRQPLINASAAPNGLVLIYSGILARIENEAELATLLGHELAHFVRRHSLQERRERTATEKSERLGRALSLGLFGGSEASSRASIEQQVSGFSQRLELEADRLGFDAMRDAGYDVRQSVRMFEVVLLDEEAPTVADPFYYADHPSMESRAAHYRQLIAAAEPGAGEIRAEPYAAATRSLIAQNIEDDLALSRVRSARRGVDRLLAFPDADGTAYLLLGEWHRLAGQAGAAGLGEAARAYERATQLAPESARAWRALGLARRDLGEASEAARALERAIELAPAALDRPILEAYVREARAGGAKP